MPHYLVIRTACDVIKPADLKILVQQGKDNKRRVRAMGNYPERTWQKSLNRLHRLLKKNKNTLKYTLNKNRLRVIQKQTYIDEKIMRAISSAAKIVKANSL